MRQRRPLGDICVGLVVVILCGAISCTSGRTSSSANGATLRDYAARAKQRGSREALIRNAGADGEEGEMLVVSSIEKAMEEYEWVVGEPIDERTFSIPTSAHSTEPDSIFTGYRFRITARLGRSKHSFEIGPLEKEVLREMPVRQNEVLVLKSGGNVSVDGVLLKQRGSACFSELLPRCYLLALATDSSGRTGWLAMGCRGIYAVERDRLIPRDQQANPVIAGMKDRFGDSLAAFSKPFESTVFAR